MSSTIRIAHIGDLHVSERRRLDDMGEVLSAFTAGIADAGVDLVLVAGDVFHTKSTPAERNLFAGFVQEVAEFAAVAIVRGNHDAPGDLEIFERLETDFPVWVFERPSSPFDPVLWQPGQGQPKVGIIALPWFDKAGLVSSLPAEQADQDTTRERTIEAARQLLDLLRVGATHVLKHDAVPVLVGHVMVAGADTSTGFRPIGQTVELAPQELLDTGAEYVALGHIHKHQEWLDGRVVYSGSLQRLDFSETEPKGFQLVTLDRMRFVGSEFIELPVRPITLLSLDLVDEIAPDRVGNYLLRYAEEMAPGALVRVRYRVRPEDLHLVDDEAIAALLRRYGAHDVKTEATLVHQERVRSEEIVLARSTWDKVLAWIKAKGIDLPDDQIDRLRQKLAALEAPQGEVSDEAA